LFLGKKTKNNNKKQHMTVKGIYGAACAKLHEIGT